ncbi:MAG: mannose-1-phosphate guanylyltransferase/mannose-6-phosphate isomerase [Nitrospirae bacterium]|nr:mannose-1-phosphate guanylyltransferase/mannose-6-phosphate isomerase [Nitrospirota bacterium]
MKAIILAGGSGTRLWPVSRKGFPKQFMKINGDKSLLCQSIERMLQVCSLEDIHIITNEDYKFHVKEELKNISKDIENNMILEPVGRNTAPAIALTIKYCLDKLGCGHDEVIFVTPSDHIIRPLAKFAEYIKMAEAIAKKGHIVTFGITPDRPETGYGYIKARSQSPQVTRRGGKSEVRNQIKNKEYLEVEEFTEKPDLETAMRFISEGGYFWNSGMFAFTIKDMLEELKKHSVEIYKGLDGSFEEVVRDFGNMPDISIDYAVMEKSDKSVVLPLDITWSDVGSWDSLFEILDDDKNKNVKIGDVIDIDTKNTMIVGNKRLISTIGLEDLIIVETDDAILIAKKGHTQKVKDIVSRLKRENRKEAVEHITIYRPWGSYTILEEGPRYKIKRIVVKPGERLSLQMHHHRSEHWIVIKGTAKVTTGKEEKFVHENESIYVPKSTPHRLENPGKLGLELIEVQNGEYVEEDDILRFEDIYGRVKDAEDKEGG